MDGQLCTTAMCAWRHGRRGCCSRLQHTDSLGIGVTHRYQWNAGGCTTGKCRRQCECGCERWRGPRGAAVRGGPPRARNTFVAARPPRSRSAASTQHFMAARPPRGTSAACGGATVHSRPAASTQNFVAARPYTAGQQRARNTLWRHGRGEHAAAAGGCASRRCGARTADPHLEPPQPMLRVAAIAPVVHGDLANLETVAHAHL